MVIPQSLLNRNWQDANLRVRCRALEELAFAEYRGPIDPIREYREGLLRNACNYLLLDGTVISALSTADLSSQQGWEIFLKAIFYVGKGGHERPNFHFYETRKFLKGDRMTQPRKKIRTISEIWGNKAGVYILYAFPNSMHEAAYTRESLMINSLCSCNLTNCGQESYYGVTKTMTPEERELLGGYLIYDIWENFLVDHREERVRPHYSGDHQ